VEDGRRHRRRLGELTASHPVGGGSAAESRGILGLLYARLTKPEHVVRHRWRPGDVAMWDNRSTAHYANRDYGTARRVMHRIPLRGDAPVGPRCDPRYGVRVIRVWRPSLVFVVCAVVVGWMMAADGSRTGAAAVAAAFLAAAVLVSPLGFPRHTPAARAQASGRPVVYWRPGCTYCLRLRLSLLGQARHAAWVNIWRDPEGAAAVRAIADGNETVPTVAAGGETRVNPDPGWVRARLKLTAPPR
jgi:mycoredoxin